VTQLPLIPAGDHMEPPRNCPQCGRRVLRMSFTRAECERCPYTWRRDSMLADGERLPYDKDAA
jgi:ribosomal protein S27AE